MTKCCMCYEDKAGNKVFHAIHIERKGGEEKYKGIILKKALCSECVKTYHKLASQGVMPMTLIDDKDEKLSWYEWTEIPRTPTEILQGRDE